MTWTEIRDPDELTALFGVPTFRAANKVRARLHLLDIEWLAASPFCLVGTSDETGRCDVSPKGDPPGRLVHVLDDTTIALAERPGNKRMDGYRNILRNPFVGLNFFVPGRGDTLRINGRARLVTEAPFFHDLRVANHRPNLCLVVEIEEVFHHCAKAFMRSKLWDPDTWNPTVLPSVAALAKATVPDAPETLEELERYYGPSYAQQLYRPKQPR
ncbi:MSMEG_1061 family FMN-dependent PPOX-type flavoprotein [Rhodococcus sp. NPDC003382]|uniref:MSMEG_1061 family FMN-dependent PPOX-type flavoprotein n=1 Tax=unclassified Rhodococcus (in: high G+C Gram-positive bacteria) TaxID=192944 RepID=UPI0018CEDDA5|nr:MULTISPECIES: MSMEG_1061 family FMN-dependent PPOX-type flavoprotein [unclassified Rhodococcus (in: high G+C Gram-positive bacteria)]MBH0122853.1 pyridoxamine 5'-phosphate oxidase family protein [Rhodococcus sp. CX]MCK8673534.1 pyridoxamine 5'-phosphate oxidase family protein [Rhodococcus sp. HM1]